MRVSRLAVVLAAAAIVLPAGMASVAMADDAPRGGRPGLTDEQRTCMEQRGFGRPDFKPGKRPERPSREQMVKRRTERMEAAKACGLPERQKWHRGPDGPGGPGGPGGHRMRSYRFQLTDEQRACMEEKGFGKPNGERPRERPSREEMAQKRSAFEAAAKECGLSTPPKA